jgi:hypothetical protein
MTLLGTRVALGKSSDKNSGASQPGACSFCSVPDGEILLPARPCITSYRVAVPQPIYFGGRIF